MMGVVVNFGEISLPAISSNDEEVAIFAARRSVDGALTVMVINKGESNMTVTLELAGNAGISAGTAYQYTPQNLTSIEQVEVASLSEDELSPTLPASSITLFVFTR